MATTSKKLVSKKTKTAPKKTITKSKKSTAKKVTKVNKNSVTVESKKIVLVKKPIAKKVTKTPGTFENLRKWNLGLSLLNALQAGLILWLSRVNAGKQPVTTSFLTRDSLASNDTQTVLVSATHRLFDVRLPWLLAAAFIVAALAHLSLATWLRARYEREQANSVNRARWISFSVVTSLVLLAIAMLSGISDIGTLFAVVVFTVIAHLVALSIEHYMQNREKSRLTYTVTAIAALTPWIIIATYAFSAHQYGDTKFPGYVYGLYATGLVALSALAVNLYMQIKARKRWTDYQFVDRNYMIIASLAVAAVAWQIYSAILKK